jgi:hypothetical protein
MDVPANLASLSPQELMRIFQVPIAAHCMFIIIKYYYHTNIHRRAGHYTRHVPE